MNIVQKRLVWLLVLIVLGIPLSGYWSFVDLHGQLTHKDECRTYKRVIVFADSQGFTDKRHVSVDMCGDK